MQPDQDVAAGAEVAAHQCDVLCRVDRAAVAHGTELAVPRGQPGLGNPFDERLGALPVGHQVGDRHQRQPVRVREPSQLGQPGHRPVVTDDLGDHAGRVQAGQPGQVDRRLGVPRTAQHPAVDRPEREHVARAGQLVGLGGRVDQHPDRPRAVGGRDAGADAVTCVDRHGVRRVLAVLVDVGHRRQLQPVQLGPLHGHADDARRVPHREREQRRCRLGRGEDEVALVLAVLVVDHHDSPAGRDVGDRPLDAVEADACAVGHARTSSGRGAVPPTGSPSVCAIRSQVTKPQTTKAP